MFKKIAQDFSPYRNAVSVWQQKRVDNAWYEFNNPVNTNPSTGNNQIHVSKNGRIAIVGVEGVLVFPVEPTGKVKPIIVPSSSPVTDLDWSPFSKVEKKYPSIENGDLLAIGFEDGVVQVYSVDDNVNLIATMDCKEKGIVSVVFNPIAMGILGVASGNNVGVWNLEKPDVPLETLSSSAQIQSMAWNHDGSTIATTSKDGHLTVYGLGKDVKAPKSVVAHEGSMGKPSRVLYLSDDIILTTGFSKVKQREWKLWKQDLELLVARQHNTNPGVLIPLYDADTRIIYLAGRGDSIFTWHELKKEAPWVTEQVTSQWSSTGSQAISIAGIGMASKFSLDTIKAEIDRLFVLGNGCLIPITIQVPRRRYAEFPGDLFPPTIGLEAGMSGQEWENGERGRVPAVLSLDPVERGKFENQEKVVEEESSAPKDLEVKKEVANVEFNPSTPVITPLSAKAKSVSAIFATNKQSPLRFATFNPHNVYSDLKGVSITTLAECDGLQVSKHHLAFPLAGAGAKVGILSIPKDLQAATKVGVPPVRLSGKIAALLLGPGDVSDFAVDPFSEETRIVTATHDGHLKLWEIQGDVTEDLSEAKHSLDKMGKIVIVVFHPYVQNVLIVVSIASDGSGTSSVITSFDLNDGFSELTRFIHPDYVMACCFSSDGSHVLTVAKDGKIRKFDLRGTELSVGSCHLGTKGARIVPLYPTDYTITVGFGKGNMREIFLYSQDLSTGPVASCNINQSPAMMTAFWEEGSGTLWLSGRGETSIFGYEVKLGESPSITPLTKFDGNGPQQGIWFEKSGLNVKEVEVMRAWRLSSNVECISFKVPRQKKEYFQDDLYGEAVWDRKVAIEGVTAKEWYHGIDGLIDKVKKINLCPDGMQPLSTAVVENKTSGGFNPSQQIAVDRGAKAFTSGMISHARELGDRESDEKVVNDKTAAVADDEWD